MAHNEQTEEALSTKVIKGSSWLFLFQILDNVLGFVRLIILARLLTPADFGLIGVAILVIQVVITFTQTGVQSLLIHKPDITKYVNVAWTYLFFRGIVLYGLLFIAAPFLGTFFHSEEASLIIRVMGVVLLLEGFTNIGVILFQKNLTFNRHFVLQITGNLVDFIVTLSAAFIFKNVWAIVAGFVLNTGTKMVLSYILSSHRPRFDFNFKLIREMNTYGKWIFSSNILTFLYSQGDDILVGRILGPAALGFYQLAYRISNLPATQISYIISTVMFPAYARIQSDKKRIATVYISTFQITAFLSFLLGSFIIAFAHDFIVLFLGARWLPMQYTLQILTIWGVLRSLGATTGALWQAVGTPEKITKIQFVQTMIMGIVIVPLTLKWGFTGTAFSVIIAALVGNSIALIQISKTIQKKVMVVLRELLYPLLCSVFLIATHYFLKRYLFFQSDYMSFVIEAVVAVLIFLSTSILLSKFGTYDIYHNITYLMDSADFLKSYKSVITKLKKLVT